MQTVLLTLALFGLASAVGLLLKWQLIRKCPSDRELRHAVLGIERNDNVISHLGICKTCRHRVADLNK